MASPSGERNERAWKEHFKAVLVAEEHAARVNECNAIGGSVGEKVGRWWAGEKRPRSESGPPPNEEQASLEGLLKSQQGDHLTLQLLCVATEAAEK
jgi:hypothetical protein